MPRFADGMREAVSCAATGNGAQVRDRVRSVIEDLDLAGMLDESRRHRHGCDAGILMANAWRLDATPGEMQAMLARSGFAG
jgi:hypothetical protein